ncbi:MAG: acetate--CoA ligase family protein [Pseudomonadota bacterium]
MRDLSQLFQPKSIAIIGGGFWGAGVVEQCTKMGFSGPVWPVHPKRDEIADVKTFANLKDLPEAPDAVFIGVNRNVTIDMVRELREMGAGGAVCFASGFREAQAEMGDGSSLQDALLEAAGDMPIVGPNCYGFINYLDGALLWPDQHGGRRVESGVAILTQSSNMSINITMQNRGLPLAYMATAGNQAQVGLADIGTTLLRDPRVTALGMHIEGIGDLNAFQALAQTAHELGKPIVALKAGKSEQAQSAAISHTASLAGSDAGARALLSRLGIAQVESLPALLETLKLLHFTGPLPSNRVVSMSCSGGEASLMADSADGRDIEFPPLSDTQKKRLRDVLGPMVALANPLDYHTFIWGDADTMGEAFTAMLNGKADIGCVIVDFPRADRCNPAAWDCVIPAGAAAAKANGKPLAVVATLPEALSETVADHAIASGVIPMHGLDDAISAIEAASALGQTNPQTEPILKPGNPTNVVTLEEGLAKRKLAEFGLAIPRSSNASSPKEVANIADGIGFPIVLKGSGAAHKTEAGLVRLNLSNSDAALEAAEEMNANQFLVEEMVTGSIGELLVGVLRDPAHGFVLTLGAGGVMTEILADTQSLLLPVNEDTVELALSKLRVSPILQGYRGKPGVDVRSVVSAVMAVQEFVLANVKELDEVEINPLICCADRAVAADALIRIGEEDGGQPH